MLYQYIIRDKDSDHYDILFTVEANCEIGGALKRVIRQVWQKDGYSSEDLIEAIHEYAEKKGIYIGIFDAEEELMF